MTPQTLARATRGDRTARRVLLDAYGPLVYGLCRRLSARDPDDAYQDVWIRIFEALPGVDPQRIDQLRGWIGTVTHRCLVDRHRRGSLRSHGPLVVEPESPNPLPDETVRSRRRSSALQQALQKLPEAQRRAVVFFHLKGRSLRQISEVEGVPVGTVKSRLNRGKSTLAHLMETA